MKYTKFCDNFSSASALIQISFEMKKIIVAKNVGCSWKRNKIPINVLKSVVMGCQFNLDCSLNLFIFKPLWILLRIWKPDLQDSQILNKDFKNG